jgi:hypothetical protein
VTAGLIPDVEVLLCGPAFAPLELWEVRLDQPSARNRTRRELWVSATVEVARRRRSGGAR